MKRWTVTLGLVLLMHATAFAQWGIGVSYELRDEDPNSGFGVRLQRSILKNVPVIDLNLRAHVSFFSEDNVLDIDPTDGVTAPSISQDLLDYDFGIGLFAGAGVGLVKPYVGVGLGSQTLRIERDLIEGAIPPIDGVNDSDETNIYWNAVFGAEIKPIPILKPFIEYRYTSVDLSSPNLAPGDNGRIIFGVLLKF